MVLNGYVCNGLFGHDNGSWDIFFCFSPSGHLVISGTTNNHIVIGPSSFNGKTAIGTYLTKANAGQLNKWCCLSIHWDVQSGSDKSSVYCNGKKLRKFTAHSSTGSNQMTFGDLNPNGLAGLNGSIAFFCIV